MVARDDDADSEVGPFRFSLPLAREDRRRPDNVVVLPGTADKDPAGRMTSRRGRQKADDSSIFSSSYFISSVRVLQLFLVLHIDVDLQVVVAHRLAILLGLEPGSSSFSTTAWL